MTILKTYEGTSSSPSGWTNLSSELYKQQLASQIASINEQLQKAASTGGPVYGAQTNPSVISERWLAEAITGVTLDLTLQGAPQIEIDFVDSPDFQFLDSPILQTQDDLDGRLATMCINYPLGTDYWWALSQVSPQADYVIQTYWVPWAVYKLMNTKKSVSTNLSKMTRAQFVQSLVTFTNSSWTTTPITGQNVSNPSQQPIYFTSKQINVVQPIVDTGSTSVRSSRVFAAFDRALLAGPTGGSASVPQPSVNSKRNQVGLDYADATYVGITCGFKPITEAQCAVATTILQQCDRQSAGRVATVAAIYAAIWESRLGQNVGPNSLGYVGTFQGKGTAAGGPWPEGADTQAQAYAFLMGGNGFQGGGAKALSATVSNPIEIAVKVEVPSIWPNNAYGSEYKPAYSDAQALQEAEAIVTTGGGSSGTGGLSDGQDPTADPSASNGSAGKSIVLTVGSTIDYWTAMNQIAQDVDWEVLVDGPYLFFDSDVTLTRSTPAVSLKRTNPAVQNWSYDWDDRNIVTNFQLSIFCDDFDYVNGDVFRLTGSGWGPAAKGSTIGLPGRWLASEVQRNPEDTFSTITLVQPQQPLNEDEGSSTGTASSPANNSFQVTNGNGTPQAVLFAARNLSGFGLRYDQSHRVLVKSLSSMRKLNYGMDCSMATSWCLLAGGFTLPRGATWGDWSPDTESYQGWGLPGKGQYMTVWCAYGLHMFIEFYVPGNNHTQMNTSYQNAAGATPPTSHGSGPRYFAWGQNGESDSKSGIFVPLHLSGM